MIGEFLLALLLLAVATIVQVDISGYPDVSKILQVGPGVFPNFISIFLYIVGFILILKLLYLLVIKKTDENGVPFLQAEKEAAKKNMESIKENMGSFIGTIGILVLMFLYASLLKTIGFEICTLVFLVGTMLFLGERRPVRLVLVPVGATAVILLIFRVFLKIALPLKILTNL